MYTSSTKSMPLRVVLCCLAMLLLVTAISGERRRFCGPLLVSALLFFCQKRNEKISELLGDSEDFASINDKPLADNSPFSYQSLPLLANFGSLTALQQRVRRDSWYLQRGDECCRKPCTREELERYCY